MTSRRLSLRHAAKQDAAGIASYCAEQGGLTLELAFVDALEAVLDLVCRQPGCGSPRHAALFPQLPTPLRFHPLQRFDRILVYYLEFPDHVEVVRIWDATRGLDALAEDTQTPE